MLSPRSALATLRPLALAWGVAGACWAGTDPDAAVVARLRDERAPMASWDYNVPALASRVDSVFPRAPKLRRDELASRLAWLADVTGREAERFAALLEARATCAAAGAAARREQAEAGAAALEAYLDLFVPQVGWSLGLVPRSPARRWLAGAGAAAASCQATRRDGLRLARRVAAALVPRRARLHQALTRLQLAREPIDPENQLAFDEALADFQVLFRRPADPQLAPWVETEVPTEAVLAAHPRRRVSAAARAAETMPAPLHPLDPRGASPLAERWDLETRRRTARVEDLARWARANPQARLEGEAAAPAWGAYLELRRKWLGP